MCCFKGSLLGYHLGYQCCFVGNLSLMGIDRMKMSEVVSEVVSEVCRKFNYLINRVFKELYSVFFKKIRIIFLTSHL